MRANGWRLTVPQMTYRLASTDEADARQWVAAIQ